MKASHQQHRRESGRSEVLEKPLGVWRIYSIWAFWVGIAFFGVYPACNWFTSQRSEHWNLFFNAELALPFYPEFVWVYMSMYLLFALPPFFLNVAQLRDLGRQLVGSTLFAGLVFLIVPSQLGFERQTPEGPALRAIYDGLFTVDLPHNMVPSLHVVFTALIILAIRDSCVGRVGWRGFWIAWLAVLCASTVLVHQHHLLDVVSGLLIAWVFRYWFSESRQEEKR